ncbi:MAG: hypothetical protein Q9207_000026 [Kuettlingeria erythrocarpa]
MRFTTPPLPTTKTIAKMLIDQDTEKISLALPVNSEIAELTDLRERSEAADYIERLRLLEGEEYDRQQTLLDVYIGNLLVAFLRKALAHKDVKAKKKDFGLAKKKPDNDHHVKIEAASAITEAHYKQWKLPKAYHTIMNQDLDYKRNAAAHDTSAEMAKILLKPRWIGSHEHRLYQPMFIFTYGGTYEEVLAASPPRPEARHYSNEV